MRIDRSPLTVLAICDQCDYRTHRPTPGAAWTALAIHAKSVHGDPRAAGRARDAARQARRREERPPAG